MSGYKTDEACHICGMVSEDRNDLHHIKTQGAKGPDEVWNLIPLCRPHHVECHAIGRTSFGRKYARFKEWLIKHEWEYIKLTNKWSHTEPKIKEGINEQQV